jgi:hypothetical protein
MNQITKLGCVLSLTCLAAATSAGCAFEEGSPEGLDEPVAFEQAELLTGTSLGMSVIAESDVPTLGAKEKAALPNLRYGRLAGDFDGDGEQDWISAADRTGFTITFGAAGKAPVRWNNTIPSSSWSVERVELGANNAISFIISRIVNNTGSGGFFDRAPQSLFLNDGRGNFQTRTLSHLNLMGRGVSCTKLVTAPEKSLCMFAGYAKDGRAWSTLTEVDAAGNVVDVTNGKGLMWKGAGGTSVGGGHDVNGKYMMGFAWVDLNGDGLPDLVGGGQHSRLMYALMRPSGASYTFGPTTWFDAIEEWMGVSAMDTAYEGFPCVYLQVEAARTNRRVIGDYVKCFNPLSSTWADVAMPYPQIKGSNVVAYVNDEEEARMTEINGTVYMTSRAKLANGTIENVLLRAKTTAHWIPTVNPSMRSEIFDPVFYLNKHPDLKAAFGNSRVRAREHWIKNGIREGRQGSATFSAPSYLARHSDLRTAFGPTGYQAAVDHYIVHGIGEGRNGAP